MIPWSSLSMASGSRMKNRKSAQISINQHQSASISINQSKIISTIRYCGSLTWVSWLAVRADRVTPHGVVDRHERCQPHTISHKSTRTHKQRAMYYRVNLRSPTSSQRSGRGGEPLHRIMKQFLHHWMGHRIRLSLR